MTSFDFWWKWLLAFTILFIIVGLAIAFFPDSPLLAAHTAETDRVFFAGAMTDDAAQLRSFLMGPLGATIAGYFLIQAFVVWGPYRRRERWAWHAVLWPLLTWFIVDSAMSIRHGAAFNVWLVNVWTLLPLGLALAMTYRHFPSKDEAEA